MVKPTPNRFNPALLARDSTQYSVNLPLRQFSRLNKMLLDDEGEMHAVFRFSRRKKIVLVSGSLKTSYRLQCQRCLEPMQAPVDESFELVFAKTEEEALEMPDGLDPVVLDENGQIHVVDLFEDELILQLPTVPRHEHLEECEASGHVLFTNDFTEHAADEQSATAQTDRETGQNEQANTGTGDADKKRKNPFDVLKNLDLH